MKKVNIAQTLIKEYSEKELVAYLADQLSHLGKVSPATSEDSGLVLGSVLVHIDRLGSIAKALSEKMNGGKEPTIVV